VIESTGEIRFLKQAELVAVLERGIPDDAWGPIERPLYLMAAMTGLRQGELLALRWLDLDAQARKVRVRQAFVRGEFKAPKSRRGSRGVPLASELHEALDELRFVSEFTADDDLIFAHPMTGKPLDRGFVYKRFKRVCRRAGVRVVRFHDLRHAFDTRVAASRRGVAAHAAGVDGPPRRQDDAHLRRLPAGRARVGNRQPRVSVSRPLPR
jgi:integrase